MVEHLLILVEGVDGVPGILGDMPHRGQGSNIEILETRLIELDRQTFQPAFVPIVALWTCHRISEVFDSIIQRAAMH
jgi:hypothetical protein